MTLAWGSGRRGDPISLSDSFPMEEGITFRFNFNFRNPAIKRIGFLMVPGLIGTGLYQMNTFIDMIFASFLPSGSVSYLSLQIDS